VNTNSIHIFLLLIKVLPEFGKSFARIAKSFAKSLPELQKFCQKSIDNFKFSIFYIRKNKKGMSGCILKGKGNIFKLKSSFFFLHKETVGSLLVHSLHKP
jgi:hypothetical protein